MSTPNQLSDTPRTDLAWAKTFEDDDDQCRAGNAATDMREACATFERELETEKTNRNHLIEKGATLERELAALRTCGELSCDECNARTAALTAERDQLRAQLHGLTLICGTNDANKFETWVDRANARADKAEAELATERARLAHVLGNDWPFHDRKEIDAAMKEDAK